MKTDSGFYRLFQRLPELYSNWRAGRRLTSWCKRLPLAQAEALAEALLDFQSPADLTAWLAEYEKGNA
ncbi:MAG: DUF4351 domain-containing protein [Candidatus Contendobacter sp.]|nr:MAG: DUF4351 domain-containing protein [Candidatus Contendobacter sp.]